MFGLDTETLEKLKTLFAQFNAIEKAVLYGSRAKGNYKPGSDIDLTLFGNNLNMDELLNVKIKIDDLMLPYKTDISLYKTIKNQELIEHIHRIGKTIYIKDE